MAAAGEAAATGAQEQQQEAIQLTSLSIEQLDMMRKQLDGDVQALQNNLQNLRMAQQRFTSAKTAISELSDADEGSEILVPLTSSVYVPGKLKSPDDLLVDVGTGFYVKKNRAAAGDVMDTKTKFVKDKADEVQRLTELKARQLSEVNSVLSQKVQAYEAQKAGKPSA